MPRLRSFTGVIAALVLVIASRGDARADSHEEPGADASASATMTLPSGAILVTVPVEVNLSTDLVAKPLSIAPDIWYGVSDDLTVGVVHSTYGSTGFFGGAGLGICVTGEDNGCGKLYDNVGLDVRYGLLDGSFSLAAEAGGFVTSIDGTVIAAKAGLQGMLPAGPVHILFSPNIFIGVTERDGDVVDGMAVGGNKEVINVPVTVALGLGPVSVGVQSGILAPLDGFADAFAIPVAAGARYMASPKLSFDAAFSFPTLYSKVADGTDTDNRALVFSTSIAL